MCVKLPSEHPLEFLSLKGGFTSSSESTFVKMPHCLKSHVAAHLFIEDLYISARVGTFVCTGPRSAVGNVSDYRCVSDCNSRGRAFDPGPVPYFR